MKWTRRVRGTILVIVFVLALMVSRQCCQAMELSKENAVVETEVNTPVLLMESTETAHNIADEEVATAMEFHGVSRVWMIIAGGAFLLILMMISMIAFK